MFHLLSPWRHPGRLFRSAGYVLTAMPFGIFCFVTTLVFFAVTIGVLPTIVLAGPMAWFALAWSRFLGKVERNRTAALMNVQIADPYPPLTSRSWWGRLWERVRTGARWREVGHHLLRMFVDTISFGLVVAAWAGSTAMLLLPLVVGGMPGDSAKFYFFELSSGHQSFAAAGVGLLGLLLVAPWLTVGLADVQLGLAKSMLGPDPDAVHAAEVATLETSRTAAVDSAEYERRRIERDLHDGAQQRLVALAANLGSAREKLDAEPEAGRQMVAEAHEEAKAALREIRDLVRGIHPVILEDRGLDAALSAVVARSPIPVELEVTVAVRPPAAVESAAYFVVNEALANVARHSHATRAHVAIARAGDRLVIEVRDNGQGGADANRGTGLRGLRDRVAGFGGSLYVISPVGGPTTISVELPCGS